MFDGGRHQMEEKNPSSLTYCYKSITNPGSLCNYLSTGGRKPSSRGSEWKGRAFQEMAGFLIVQKYG